MQRLSSIPGLKRSLEVTDSILQRVLVENSHGQESGGLYSPIGCKESNVTEQLSTTHKILIKGWNLSWMIQKKKVHWIISHFWFPCLDIFILEYNCIVIIKNLFFIKWILIFLIHNNRKHHKPSQNFLNKKIKSFYSCLVELYNSIHKEEKWIVKFFYSALVH